MAVDLHIHTTASDGLLEPSQVVMHALQLGLQAIAITDHDTTAGIQSAIDTAKNTPLEVIPGIEISTDWLGKEIHILGYYLDFNNPCLNKKLTELNRQRVERIKAIVAKLNQLGVMITVEEVCSLAGEGTIGRPHVALAMQEKGYVSSVSQAFEEYIGTNGPAYVPRGKITPSEAARMVIAAAGIPVLAHPGLSNGMGLIDLIKKLKQSGLMGIEVYHPCHDSSATLYYEILAKEYGLIPTGGTDFHGLSSKGHEMLGSIAVPYEVVKQLKKVKGI